MDRMNRVNSHGPPLLEPVIIAQGCENHVVDYACLEINKICLGLDFWGHLQLTEELLLDKEEGGRAREKAGRSGRFSFSETGHLQVRPGRGQFREKKNN